MDPLIVDETLWLCENSVFLPFSKTLVIADLQLGYEQSLRKLGHNIIYEQAEKMLRLLEKLVIITKAERIVINGDLKHEFGRISGQERRDILHLIRKLERRVEVIVVKGNHDTITKPLTDELGVEFKKSWEDENFLCVHGHELPEKIKKNIIIGHLHPAVTLHDGVRKERFKAFMIGKYRGKRLVVLPSFSTIVEGTDVLTSGSHSPLVDKKTVDSSELYVIADEIRYFGKAQKLRKLLESQ